MPPAFPAVVDVQSYYVHTRFDYRAVWNHRDNLAAHFGFYDENADKHQQALSNMNRVLANLAAVQPGERVLDAGCGMGSACFWLVQHRQAQVTGVSLIAEQVSDCQKVAARRQIENVAFVQADFCEMPFADGSFDVVWACESLCHAVQKADFYREAFRVLKPGGRLVIADFVRSARPSPPQSEALLAAWLRPWAILDLDTAEEHQQAARQAGFKSVELRDVTPNVRVSLRNLHELCTRWLPIGKVLRFLGVVNDIRLNNVRASIRQYEALQAGAWYYAMILAKK